MKTKSNNVEISTETASRLDWAITTLHDILHGEKPRLDKTDAEQSWLYDQMTRMYRAGFLAEEPKSYLSLNDENVAEVMHFKGSTIREPLPKALTSQVKDLKERADKSNVHNFKVFGADVAYRYRKDVLEQMNDADSFVLSHGGVMAMYQFLVGMRAQLEGSLPLEDKAFVVQSFGGFWDPTLKAFGEAVHGLENYHVTDTRHATVETLEVLLGDHAKDNKAQWGDEHTLMQPGTDVLFVTGNRKKVQDYNKVFRRRGTDVNTHWFQQIFDKPEGAEEFSYSYMGNLVEKIEKFYVHIRDHYGVEGFEQVAAAKKLDLDKAVLWFDDSGLELEENLTNGEEFGNCTYRMNSYKEHGPAAEMKNAINAMQNQPFEGERGARGFFKRLEAAADRLQMQRAARGDEKPEISTDAYDRACVAIVPIRPLLDVIANGGSFEEVMNTVPMEFIQARTDDRIVFKAQPDLKGKAVDSKNFLIPKKDPENRSKAENPQYTAQHSVNAQIVKAAARALGFDKFETGDRTLTGAFNRSSAMQLGTQQSLHAGMKVHGIGRGLMKSLRGKFSMINGNGGKYDLSKPREHTLKLEDGEEMKEVMSLQNFYDFTLRADGFLLTQDTKSISGPEYFWERAFTFFSLVVGRQINDKAVTSKPLLVTDTPGWRPFLQLMEEYGGGLIPELPHEILDGVISESKDIPKALKRAFSEYKSDEVPQYSFTHDGDKCPEDLFCVTVYCSASTTDYPMKMWGRDFAFDLAGLGFAVKNGGGTGPDGLMIETSEGVRIAKNDFDAYLKKTGVKEGAPRTHVASIQCTDTAQEEGLCKFNDYWAVYPTIYQRMHELQKAQAEVVLPGGAGTIQEIAASVLMRKAGVFPVKHRPLIIVNHEGIYDPLMDIIPEEDFKKYNIQVVDSADDAMEILIKARKAMKMEPALPYTEAEFFEMKKGFNKEQQRHDKQAALKAHTID